MSNPERNLSISSTTTINMELLPAHDAVQKLSGRSMILRVKRPYDYIMRFALGIDKYLVDGEPKWKKFDSKCGRDRVLCYDDGIHDRRGEMCERATEDPAFYREGMMQWADWLSPAILRSSSE